MGRAAPEHAVPAGWVDAAFEGEDQLKAATISWPRAELVLDAPTEAGEIMVRLWSNLPGEAGAGQIAEPHRPRRRIEAMFGRLEDVLNCERASLAPPRSAAELRRHPARLSDREAFQPRLKIHASRRPSRRCQLRRNNTTSASRADNRTPHSSLTIIPDPRRTHPDLKPKETNHEC